MRDERHVFFRAAMAAETDECIVWPYGVNSAGYGQWTINYVNHSVHVVACTEAHGPRPPSMQVRHLCGAPECVNPRHLRWGTAAENAADRARHGRTVVGERINTAKLTADDVHAIRASRESLSVLAARFGVAKSSVSKVKRRLSWRHLEEGNVSCP